MWSITSSGQADHWLIAGPPAAISKLQFPAQLFSWNFIQKHNKTRAAKMQIDIFSALANNRVNQQKDYRAWIIPRSIINHQRFSLKTQPLTLRVQKDALAKSEIHVNTVQLTKWDGTRSLKGILHLIFKLHWNDFNLWSDNENVLHKT